LTAPVLKSQPVKTAFSGTHFNWFCIFSSVCEMVEVTIVVFVEFYLILAIFSSPTQKFSGKFFPEGLK
jgi:hypothetical protein